MRDAADAPLRDAAQAQQEADGARNRSTLESQFEELGTQVEELANAIVGLELTAAEATEAVRARDARPSVENQLQAAHGELAGMSELASERAARIEQLEAELAETRLHGEPGQLAG